MARKKPRSRAKKKAVKRRVLKKRVAKKKIVKKRPIKKKAVVTQKPKEKIVGLVTHYFPHVRAAVIKLKAPLNVGDGIKVKGHTTGFSQNVTSMQIDHVPINAAKKGQEIGLLVDSRVRQHDVVYKL